MEVSGVESVGDPAHAEAVVNKTLADKDRSVRTPSEDSNESMISPVLCKAEEVKACRADAARGNCLGLGQTRLAMQRGTNFESHVKANRQGSQQSHQDG